MRPFVGGLGIVALLATWLITRDPEDTGPNEILNGREIAPVSIPIEPDSAIADQEAVQAMIPDDDIANAETVTDTIESNGVSGSGMQASAIEFDPEQRGKIVEYFSERGLAASDGERIADSALDGVRGCIARAFANGEGAASYVIETCMYNVFAAHGLTEIAVTD